MKDLELSILSCLVLEPKLTLKLKVKEEHFKKHRRLFLFMKSFYARFGTYDIQLMYSVCKSKWNILNYIELLMDVEVSTKNFELYQDRLIELYYTQEKDRWIADKVFKTAIDFSVGTISSLTFQSEVEKIYKEADAIYQKNIDTIQRK